MPRDDRLDASARFLAGLRGLDDEAWSRFRSVYGPVIRNFCRRCGVSERDLDDLTQDVFAKLAGSIDGFSKDRGDSLAWLATVARTPAAAPSIWNGSPRCPTRPPTGRRSRR